MRPTVTQIIVMTLCLKNGQFLYNNYSVKIYNLGIYLSVFTAGLPAAAQMSSYYNSAYGSAAGFGSAMHNSHSLAAAAAAAAANASPAAHQVVSSMQDAMKAYSSGMDDKYRYSAISSMYPSAEAVAAAAAQYMKEAAGKSYLDSGNSRYFDGGSPNKHFTPGKYVPFL